MVEFLILFTIIAFASFEATDAALIMGQHQAAKHLLKQMADRVRYEGRLSTADEAMFVNKFSQIGLPVESITTVKEPQARVLRDPSNPTASMITISVVCKPTQKPFVIGSLIGGQQVDNTWRIKVETTVYSERVNP
ncbi:MAG: hypothetical protein HPY90_05500 [Syntrophothermus sp.]|uniref:hypothetical protein n=1 Tax=Syntrophothermus sp. TaxID=2736299 RepID=UPI00257FBE55|nr:hypothetical protein [Syntrophothermus sp.]NSW82719.1 hypothetical protein [Syntrophothermus sp.]